MLSGLMSLVKFHHRNASTNSFSAAFRRKSSVSNSDGFIRSLTVPDALLTNPGELNTGDSPVFDLWFEKEAGSMSEVLLMRWKLDNVILMQKEFKNSSPLKKWSQSTEKRQFLKTFYFYLKSI